MTNKIPLRLRIHPRYYVLPLFVGSLIFAGHAKNTDAAATTRHHPRLGEVITGHVSEITRRSPRADTYSNKVTLTTPNNLSATFNATDIDLERLPLGQGVSVTLRRCPAILTQGRTGTAGLLCLDTLTPL